MAVWRTLLASLLILAAGALALAAVTDGFNAFTTETARRLDVGAQPRALPPALLETAEGEYLRLADLAGRWLIVDFIYTRCMTYCTVQGSDFARLQAQLAEPLASGQVVLLTLSFDPLHDDSAALAAYRTRLGGRADAGWIAARPVGAGELEELMATFGITAIDDGLGGYVHNAAINVVDPAGRLVAVFDWNAPATARDYVLARLAP